MVRRECVGWTRSKTNEWFWNLMKNLLIAPLQPSGQMLEDYNEALAQYKWLTNSVRVFVFFNFFFFFFGRIKIGLMESMFLKNPDHSVSWADSRWQCESQDGWYLHASDEWFENNEREPNGATYWRLVPRCISIVFFFSFSQHSSERCVRPCLLSLRISV